MDPWWTRCRAEDNEYHCCGSFGSGSQSLCESYVILYVWETGLLLTQWLTKTMHDKPKIQFSFVGPSDLLPVFSSPLLAAWPRQVSFYFSAFLEWLSNHSNLSICSLKIHQSWDSGMSSVFCHAFGWIRKVYSWLYLQSSLQIHWHISRVKRFCLSFFVHFLNTLNIYSILQWGYIEDVITQSAPALLFSQTEGL